MQQHLTKPIATHLPAIAASPNFDKNYSKYVVFFVSFATKKAHKSIYTKTALIFTLIVIT